MEAAQAYNRELLENIELPDPFSPVKQEVEQRYENTLNINSCFNNPVTTQN